MSKNNVPARTHFHVARGVIENLSALSISAGGADGVFDTALAVDANGLPFLPGTAIAGVLRHVYERENGTKAAESLFGHQTADEGENSRLLISAGTLLGSKGQAIVGLAIEAQAQELSDEIFAAAIELASEPSYRDRVSLSALGVSNNHFNRVVLPAGHRFAFEISLWGDESDAALWEEVLGYLSHPLFRLGGGSRTGLGRVELSSLHQGVLDLTTPDDFTAFTKLGQVVTDIAELAPLSPEPPTASDLVTASLTLKPLGLWRIGQGEAGELLTSKGQPADLLPVTENYWKWTGSSPEFCSRILVSGTSIKGALAHRAAFHYLRGCKPTQWAGTDVNPATFDKSKLPAVQSLFGYANDNVMASGASSAATGAGSSRPDAGLAGRLIVDDGCVSDTSRELYNHNSIDRFTGGVRNHFLYSEEVMLGGSIEITLTIETRDVDDQMRLALKLALRDLCTGRLALGAKSSCGHGFAEGKLNWSDGGDWISKPASENKVNEKDDTEAAA